MALVWLPKQEQIVGEEGMGKARETKERLGKNGTNVFLL